MTKEVKEFLDRNYFDSSAFSQVEEIRNEFPVLTKNKVEFYDIEIPAGTLIDFTSKGSFDISFPKNWEINGATVKKFSRFSPWTRMYKPKLRLRDFILGKKSNVNGIVYPEGTRIKLHYEKGQTMAVTPSETFQHGDSEYVGGVKYWVNDCKPSAKAKGHWKSTAAKMDNETCLGLWDGREKKKKMRKEVSKSKVDK